MIDVPQIPFISREVFIENSCAGEGRAVINNITARNEIYAFSNQSADIGYAAATDQSWWRFTTPVKSMSRSVRRFAMRT